LWDGRRPWYALAVITQEDRRKDIIIVGVGKPGSLWARFLTEDNPEGFLIEQYEELAWKVQEKWKLKS